MAAYLDLEHWPRRPLYEFFRSFEQPFFNITATVEVTRLRDYCRAHGRSFFLASLYCCARVANGLEPFRYRLRDEGVWVHDQQDIGSTVMQADDLMTYAYFPYQADFNAFHREAEERVAAVKAGYRFDPADDRDDLIHHSILPWMHFTSFMHARRQRHNDAIPKIVFGQYREEHGQVRMPLSIEVHHALMDGVHVGRYFAEFEALCMSPEWALD